ncbi:hypothetical protein GF322_00760 [Candidatus Dependentiae bacterium]|nr:hypothetical protein [Candidatus Dependentiae bacterium]
MVFADIQVALLNLIIGIFAFTIGTIYFIKSKEKISLCIGVAFAFFGISHLFLLANKTSTHVALFLSLRTIAYSTIIIYLLVVLISKLINTLKSRLYFFLITTGSFIVFFLLLTYYIVTLYNKLKTGIFPFYHIYSLNAFYGILITFFSYICYKIKHQKIYLFLSISFIFFATSHIAALFNLQDKVTILFILIRLSAYVSLIIGIMTLSKIKILSVVNKTISDTKFQITLIVFSVLTLIIMFYLPQAEFRSSDPFPIIEQITPKVSEEQIVEVQTGMYVKNFPVFNITNNNFIMNAIIWFEFDPHLISLENIEKFSFEKGTITQKSKPEVKIIEEKLFVRYKVQIKFQSNLNYNIFPLEDHTISIALINTHLNPKEVVLTSKNSSLLISDKLFTGDWKHINNEVYYGYSISQIDKFNPQKTTSYPTVVFLLDFEKLGIKDTLIIFVPLYIAFFLCLFSLILSIHNTRAILSLSVGSISALIVNLFILEKLTPEVSYFTISDAIFTTLLISVFAILLFNIFAAKQVTSKKYIKELKLIRSYIFIFLTFFILLFTHYILF